MILTKRSSHRPVLAVGGFRGSIPIILCLGTILLFAFIGCNDEPKTPTKPIAATSSSPPVERASTPPPNFRNFRSEMNQITSLVVPADSTDEQIKSLLWFIREKIRSGSFADIGIT